MQTVPAFVDRHFVFPRLIHGAPPSVRLVYAGLHLGVARSVPGLRDGLALPERTVRDAVRWLIAHGLARRAPVIGDTRRQWVLPVEVPT
jgi:hypothetical protein